MKGQIKDQLIRRKKRDRELARRGRQIYKLNKQKIKQTRKKDVIFGILFFLKKSKRCLGGALIGISESIKERSKMIRKIFKYLINSYRDEQINEYINREIDRLRGLIFWG